MRGVGDHAEAAGERRYEQQRDQLPVCSPVPTHVVPRPAGRPRANRPPGAAMLVRFVVGGRGEPGVRGPPDTPSRTRGGQMTGATDGTGGPLRGPSRWR